MVRKSFFTIVLFFIFLNIIFSCKDNNLVENNNIQNQIDTNSKYDWYYIATSGLLYGYCIADSQNIYFAGEPTPQHFNGTSFENIDMHEPNFKAFGAESYNKNTVYFGGYLFTGNKYIPYIKKWESGNITNYSLQGNDENIVQSMIVNGYDDLFATTDKNFVYHLQSGNIESYILDSGTINGTFLRTSQGQVYLFKLKHDSLRKMLYIYNYLFNNNIFQKISIDSACMENGCPLSAFIKKCGDDVIMGGGNNKFYYFNGNKWLLHNPIPPVDSTIIYFIGGNSKDDFIYLDDSRLFIYRNNKWSLERAISRLPLIGIADPSPRVFMNYIFFTRISFDYCFSDLMIGKLKQFR